MKRILKYALVQTLPVLCGYVFLGMAFGILLSKAGFGLLWAFLISLVVYAGSMQFVMVSFLGGGVGLLTIAVMTLSINSRHIFYGLSFLDRFKKMGKKGLYMIFSLTDETYSILCGTKALKGMNEDQLFFVMALLDQIYWIVGSITGAALGQLITFDTTGIDFAMTALFVVIFVEQWISYHSHIPAITGVLCGAVSLFFLGPDRFLLPALIAAVFFLMLCKHTIERKQGEA